MGHQPRFLARGRPCGSGRPSRSRWTDPKPAPVASPGLLGGDSPDREEPNRQPPPSRCGCDMSPVPCRAIASVGFHYVMDQSPGVEPISA